jgi:hypothetical protein
VIIDRATRTSFHKTGLAALRMRIGCLGPVSAGGGGSYDRARATIATGTATADQANSPADSAIGNRPV